MPNVLTDQERDARSPYASWARRARLAAKIPSAKKAQAALEERIGYRIGDDYLRGIEAGTNKPAYELVKKLAELYETVPPPEYRRGDSEGGGDAATLVAALRTSVEAQTAAFRAQTALLTEILVELRMSRALVDAQHTDIGEGVGRLEGLVAHLVEQDAAHTSSGGGTAPVGLER